jgi:paraquat-inducible protein B
MPPKHRQHHAPLPKLAGNAYKALVDLPHDGSDPFTDGRDGKVDGSDGKSTVNTPQRVSAAETTAAASTQLPPDVAPDHSWHEQLVREATAAYLGILKRGPKNTFEYSAATLVAITDQHYHIQECLQAIDDFLRSQAKLSHDFIYKNFQTINRKLNLLLEKVDTVIQETTTLHAANEDSRKEKAVPQAVVDNLTCKLDEHTTMSAPPSPEITASSTTMEEMTMQLSVIQHDIQDVLAAVHNPPSKRKRCTSNQDAKPAMPTNRRPATNRQ